MKKTNRSGARDIIFKVFQRCLLEQEAGQILSNLEDVYARTAVMTGKSESTVRRIVDEGYQNGGKFETPGKHRSGRPKKEMDNFNICALRQKIQFFYFVKKEVPTLRKLQLIAKTDLDFDCSLEVMRKILISIGFSYKKCQNNRKALIEQAHIAAKREDYLAIIKKNRDLPEELRKDIIYLDESYIHSSYKVRKCWQSLNVEGVTENISKGKRFIIVHAGSEKGFVPNCLLTFSEQNKLEDYHSEMNAHNFTKWITEKLIPNLHEPSIIVMDNAPYHSVVKNKVPTSKSRVDEIKLWLLENGIDFDPTLRKPNLLNLVKKNKPRPIYIIDELLEENGHTVVRLPPYHCDLNPIELIWAQVKQKVAQHNVGSRDVKRLTEEAFNSITPEIWKNCCSHVANIEKEYYERGRTLYQDIDDLVIRLGEDSSTTDSSSEDVDDDAVDNENTFLNVEYLESDSENDT